MRRLLLGGGAIVSLALGCASSSASSDAPAAHAAIPGGGPRASASGTIQNYTHGPNGEVDGFVLATGQRVHVPPEVGPQLSDRFAPNTSVEVTGVSRPDPDGRTVIEADTLTNPTSHATLDVAAQRRPPPPPGPGMAPGGPATPTSTGGSGLPSSDPQPPAPGTSAPLPPR